MRKLTIDELAKFDPNIRFNHPNFELHNVFKFIPNVGAKQFLRSPKYDSERHMLIACMFAYATRLLEKREWFLRRGDNPPDFEMVATASRELKDKPIDFCQIEIVQIPPSFTDSQEAFEMIKRKKLSNYSIENESILLIFINHHEGPLWSEELKNDFRTYEGCFSQIWAIYLLKVTLEESFIYSVKCINPGGDILTLSLKEEFKKGLIYKNPYLEKLGVKITKTFS